MGIREETKAERKTEKNERKRGGRQREWERENCKKWGVVEQKSRAGSGVEGGEIRA